MGGQSSDFGHSWKARKIDKLRLKSGRNSSLFVVSLDFLYYCFMIFLFLCVLIFKVSHLRILRLIEYAASEKSECLEGEPSLKYSEFENVASLIVDKSGLKGITSEL